MDCGMLLRGFFLLASWGICFSIFYSEDAVAEVSRAITKGAENLAVSLLDLAMKKVEV